MDYRQLGRTGLELSRIGLGCGNFGGIGSAPEFFGQGETEDEAFALMDAAWAAGITFFDTAAAYGGGRSEAWIGKWRRASAGEPVLLSSKVYRSVTGDPDDRGLSRERILRELEGSLERLGVERLDLYLTHEPDPETPIEETLRALDELVQSGKVRAIGSEQPRRGAAAGGAGDERPARARAVRLGAERVQPAPAGGGRRAAGCVQREGLGFTPFSPLGGGWLTGKYRRGERLSGRVADDAAAGALRGAGDRGDLPCAGGVRGGSALRATSSRQRSRSPGCSVTRR